MNEFLNNFSFSYKGPIPAIPPKGSPASTSTLLTAAMTRSNRVAPLKPQNSHG